MYQRDVAKNNSAVLRVDGNDRDPRQEDGNQVDDCTEKENWITEPKKILVDIHFGQRMNLVVTKTSDENNRSLSPANKLLKSCLTLLRMTKRKKVIKICRKSSLFILVSFWYKRFFLV